MIKSLSFLGQVPTDIIIYAWSPRPHPIGGAISLKLLLAILFVLALCTDQYHEYLLTEAEAIKLVVLSLTIPCSQICSLMNTWSPYPMVNTKIIEMGN